MRETRNKERRLLELLAKVHPNGMSSSELADALDISVQAVRDMIERLRQEGHEIEDNEKSGRATRYLLAPQKYVQHIKLSQAQSWMLYLSIRRIVRAQQHRFPIVKMLIEQLTQALHPAHQIGIPAPNEEADEQADDIFRQLVEAWFNNRWITIHYRPLNKATANIWRIAPLWFEPAIWSDSNYVVCCVESLNKPLVTLKLDRIEKIGLISGDTFQPPDIDTILTQIQDAWGVWLGEDDAPQQVILRFDNRVLDRLRETRWHPTQQIDTTIGDGKVEWRALISEPREMLPWIRGWGVDVEVIEPQWLRDEIGAEAERMAKMYGRMIDNDERGFF